MSGSRRVWSSEGGRMCPGCKRLQTACRCKAPKAKGAGPDDGIVRVSRSTKGRGGKIVTVVTGIPLQGDALKKLAKTLKAACGAGGALKDGALEMQGEHRDALIPLLEAKGWTVKRVGG